MSSSVRLGAVASHHEHAQPLAELLVGNADGRGLEHPGMQVQEILDLSREDVLTAGDDHLVVAPVDEEATRGVEMADITG